MILPLHMNLPSNPVVPGICSGVLMHSALFLFNGMMQGMPAPSSSSPSPLPWNPLSARMTAVSIPISRIMLPKALASRTLPGWLL